MSDLSAIEEQLGYLQGLFKRKLMEDRAKNELIEALQESLAQRDALASGAVFRDMFREALAALDRLQSEQASADLAESVRDELLEVFARRGLEPVPRGGQVDAATHEIIGTVVSTEEYPPGHIVVLQREGFTLDGRLVRPARVVVAVAETPTL